MLATVAKAQTSNSDKALILCVAGGKHCDAEMARQPAPAGAIKTEMASKEFGVRVAERYPGTKSKTSKSIKKNGKPKDGKGGKDKREESVKGIR